MGRPTVKEGLMSADPDFQHACFLEAVDLLGGSRSAARAIDLSERSMTRLIARRNPLHDGFLRDIAAALIEHARRCRALEKRLSPMFADNLTADQPHETRRR